VIGKLTTYPRYDPKLIRYVMYCFVIHGFDALPDWLPAGNVTKVCFWDWSRPQ